MLFPGRSIPEGAEPYQPAGVCARGERVQRQEPGPRGRRPPGQVGEGQPVVGPEEPQPPGGRADQARWVTFEFGGLWL